MRILALVVGAHQLLVGHASWVYFVFTFLQIRSLLHLILNDLFESLEVLDFIYHLFGAIQVRNNMLLVQYLIAASKERLFRHYLGAVLGVRIDHE